MIGYKLLCLNSRRKLATIGVSFLLCAVAAINAHGQKTNNKADQNLRSMARVNPSTLAMEFTLPIFTYPGRGGNGLPLAFSYSSKIWTMERFNYRSDPINLGPEFDYWELRSTNDLWTKFSERKIAGWSSTLMPPVLIENVEMYNQFGLDYRYSSQSGSQLTDDPNCQTENVGIVPVDSCESGLGAQTITVCCTGSTRPCPAPTTSVTNVCTTPIGPPPDGTPGNPIGSPTAERQIPHLVQQTRIQMPDGTRHEFRKSDRVLVCQPYYSEPYDDCTVSTDGTYLSVDGTGMRLERGVIQPNQEKRDILYLPDGGRYFFNSLNPPGLETMAERFIDADGNLLSFNTTNFSWTDTLERTIADPLANPVFRHSPTVGTQVINTPRIGNAEPSTNQAVWKSLRPADCANGTDNCAGNILEDFDENGQPNYELSYLGDVHCNGMDATPKSPSLFASAEPEITWAINPIVRHVGIQRVCTNYFNSTTSYRFNPVVLAEFVLPNGTKYEFKYNRYGEITRIKYPTGGYERFRYDTIPMVGIATDSVYAQTNRGVKERWVSFDGSTEAQHWQYDAGGTGFTSSGLDEYSVTTTAPDGTKSRTISLHPSDSRFGLEDPRNGLPVEERVYSSGCQATDLALAGCDQYMLRRSLTEMIAAPPRTGGNPRALRDARPAKTTSIIFELGSSQALATMTENEYDTSTEDLDFAHLNLKRTKQYQYVALDLTAARTGSLATIAAFFTPDKLARSSETDFLYSSDYRARNLHGLPMETRAYNATGSLIAKAQMGFDDGTPVSYGASPSSWVDPGSAKRGLLTSSKACSDISGSTCSNWVETRMQYDQFGNPVNRWDANQIAANHTGPQYATHTDFDESQFNSTYKWAFPFRITTPAPDPSGTTGSTTGFVASSTYDTNTGLVLTTTELNGQTTSMQYNDPLLRPTKIIPPAGKAQTVNEYGDQPGNIFVRTKSQVDANNWVESIQNFDNALRPTRTSQQDSAGLIVSDTQYDPMGRAYKVSNPYRSGGTPVWTVSAFDVAGRVDQVTSPDGSTVHTSFGLKTDAAPLGTMTLATDQSGKKRLALTDSGGNLTDVWEIKASDGETSTVPFQGANQTGYRTSYLYDVLGKLHEVQQGAQHRYFMYDSLGRLIRAKNVEQETNTNLPAITDPVSQHSGWAQAYTHDPNGNLLVTTTARNATITNTYDALGRVTKRDYSDAAMPDVEYKYDTVTHGLGKATSVSNGLATTRFTEYSVVGELLKSQQEFAGVIQPYMFEYTYNLAGQLVSETYPSGRVVTNTFDNLGKLASVSSNTANANPHIYANGFGYNEKGVMDRMRLGNGLWESYQVNSRFQTTEIDLGTSANSTNRLRLNYSYGSNNNNGNVRSQTITVPTINGATGFVATQDYTYDDLNRLASVAEKQYGQNTPDWQQQFTYDRYGNRSMGTGSGQTFGRNTTETVGLIGPDPTVSTSTNRITNRTGELYQFDASGNMIRDALGNRSIFDVENHQVEYYYPTNNTQVPDAKYFYDGDGRRIKKVVGSETTIFVYDAAGKMAAEYTLGVSANPNPQTSYLTTDTLGSLRVATNAAGQVIARHDYLPFGDEILGLGGRTSAQGFGMPDATRQRFTGYEKDTESGLDFAQARYYGNGLGRFTSVDPLLDSVEPLQPQSWNRYLYTVNNPLRFVDPTGLIWGQAEGDDFYRWFDTAEEMSASGYSEATRFVYEVNGTWYAVNPKAQKWESFGTEWLAKSAYWKWNGLESSFQDWIPVWGSIRQMFYNMATENYEGALGNFAAASFDGGTLGASAVNRRGALTVVSFADDAARELAKKGTTTLYRAVSEAEFEQIMKDGVFKAGPNSMEGKWFWESAEHAVSFGEKVDKSSGFRVVSAELSNSEASQLFRLDSLDNIGPARYAELSMLQNAKIGVVK